MGKLPSLPAFQRTSPSPPCNLAFVNLVDALKHSLRRSANGAFIRSFALHRIAAVLADIKWLPIRSLALFESAQGRLKQAVVNLLNLICQAKAVLGFILAFGLSLLNEARIHLSELVLLTANRDLEVFVGRLDPVDNFQMVTSVNCLSICCRTKQPRYLFVALSLSFLCENKYLRLA